MLTHERAMESLAAERYLLGEMKGAEREEFEEHYFGCLDCARDVKDLQTLVSGVRAEGGSLLPAAPSWAERLAAWWAQPQLGLAAAAALVVLSASSGYQAWQQRSTGTVSESGAESVSAVSSYPLRPETRGEALYSTLAVESGQKQVLLEMDLPGMEGEVVWKLFASQAEDKAISGKGTAPVAGASWKLLIPTTLVERNREYVLSVSSQNGTANYRFRFLIPKT